MYDALDAPPNISSDLDKGEEERRAWGRCKRCDVRSVFLDCQHCEQNTEVVVLSRDISSVHTRSFMMVCWE